MNKIILFKVELLYFLHFYSFMWVIFGEHQNIFFKKYFNKILASNKFLFPHVKDLIYKLEEGKSLANESRCN